MNRSRDEYANEFVFAFVSKLHTRKNDDRKKHNNRIPQEKLCGAISLYGPFLDISVLFRKFKKTPGQEVAKLRRYL